VVAIGNEDHGVDLQDEGRAHFSGKAHVTLSHPRFLEFMAPGISKAVGVRWLARRLGVELAQCLVVGDGYNDLEMIQEVGHGVAMPSAPAGVLAVARYVAPPVAEEGVAQIIEQVALDGWRPRASAGMGPEQGSRGRRIRP